MKDSRKDVCWSARRQIMILLAATCCAWSPASASGTNVDPVGSIFSGGFPSFWPKRYQDKTALLEVAAHTVFRGINRVCAWETDEEFLNKTLTEIEWTKPYSVRHPKSLDFALRGAEAVIRHIAEERAARCAENQKYYASYTESMKGISIGKCDPTDRITEDSHMFNGWCVDEKGIVDENGDHALTVANAVIGLPDFARRIGGNIDSIIKERTFGVQGPSGAILIEHQVLKAGELILTVEEDRLNPSTGEIVGRKGGRITVYTASLSDRAYARPKTLVSISTGFDPMVQCEEAEGTISCTARYSNEVQYLIPDRFAFGGYQNFLDDVISVPVTAIRLNLQIR